MSNRSRRKKQGKADNTSEQRELMPAKKALPKSFDLTGFELLEVEFLNYNRGLAFDVIFGRPQYTGPEVDCYIPSASGKGKGQTLNCLLPKFPKAAGATEHKTTIALPPNKDFHLEFTCGKRVLFAVQVDSNGTSSPTTRFTVYDKDGAEMTALNIRIDREGEPEKEEAPKATELPDPHDPSLDDPEAFKAYDEAIQNSPAHGEMEIVPGDSFTFVDEAGHKIAELDFSTVGNGPTRSVEMLVRNEAGEEIGYSCHYYEAGQQQREEKRRTASDVALADALADLLEHPNLPENVLRLLDDALDNWDSNRPDANSREMLRVWLPMALDIERSREKGPSE